MYMSTITLSCRETKIEAVFKLWDETPQDDHRLAGRKERLDYLMNEKRTLLMLLTGRHLLDLSLCTRNSFHDPYTKNYLGIIKKDQPQRYRF